MLLTALANTYNKRLKSTLLRGKSYIFEDFKDHTSSR